MSWTWIILSLPAAWLLTKIIGWIIVWADEQTPPDWREGIEALRRMVERRRSDG